MLTGDIVCMQTRPVACVLHSQHVNSRCHQCWQSPEAGVDGAGSSGKTSSLLRCTRCRHARYCNRECQVWNIALLVLIFLKIDIRVCFPSLQRAAWSSHAAECASIVHFKAKHEQKDPPPQVLMLVC